jgi:hypothetical protein
MYNRDEYGDVPGHLLDALDRYAKEGAHTGDFLKAVLENNLFKAVAHGDPVSMSAFKKIVIYINCQLPSGCWGSPEQVKAWKEKKRNTDGGSQ